MLDSNAYWAPPQSDGLLAAYHIDEDVLQPCGSSAGTETDTARAQQTLDILRASKQISDTAFVVVKSSAGTSLGFANGGIIIVGNNKLNVGLYRAATRALTPVTLTAPETEKFSSEERFRRVFWAIATRLHGTVLPRVYQFELGVVQGKITVKDAALRFAGDFLTPTDFIGELRAACDVADEVRYTFDPAKTRGMGKAYRVEDLLLEIAAPTADGMCRFDAEGWPLAWGQETAFCKLSSMSSLARSACAITQDNTPELSAFSEANQRLLSGKTTADSEFEINVAVQSAPVEAS